MALAIHAAGNRYQAERQVALTATGFTVLRFRYATTATIGSP